MRFHLLGRARFFRLFSVSENQLELMHCIHVSMTFIVILIFEWSSLSERHKKPTTNDEFDVSIKHQWASQFRVSGFMTQKAALGCVWRHLMSLYDD
jgi:Tfp pilus assembly pilus retraction ATPase PilT